MNSEINKTNDEQMSAIALEDELRSRLENPDKNYIVSAGAGAGKTEMMSKAVLNMLNGDRELQPSQTVVITFTNAAVEELRKRINEKYHAMRKADADFREINTDDINVSTIHSFCSSLVRQRVFDCGLGIAPDYSEESEGSDGIVMQFIRDHMNDRKNRIELMLLREYWGSDTANVIFDNASGVLKIPGLDIQGEYISDNPKREEFRKSFSSCFAEIEKAVQSFEPDVKDLKELKEDVLDWGRNKSLGEMLSFAGSIAKNADKKSGSLNDKLQEVEGKLKAKANTRDKNMKEKLLKRIAFTDEILDSIKKYNIDSLCTEMVTDRTACTIGYIKKMYEALDNKRAEMKLDMNNILYRTAELMKNENAVKYFREKYRVVFVDEFQDTDYLQLKILLAICTEGGILRDKSIFLVGDEKQSIYRFRGAEVGFFDYVRRTYFNTEKSESCSLSMNFRSQKELIDGVNDLYGAGGKFGFLLDSGSPAETDTDYNPMFTKIIPEDNGDADDSVIVSEKMSKPVEKKTLGELVDFISGLRSKEIRLVRRNDNGSVSFEKRRVKWGDILVLTSFKEEATSIYEALKKNGIPASVSGENHPGENRAIKRVCALIKYLKEKNNLHLAEVAATFSPESMSFTANGVFTEQDGTIFDRVSNDDIEKISEMISEARKMCKECGPMAALYDALVKGRLTDKKVNYITMASELPLLYQFFEGMYENSCDNIDAISEYADGFVSVEHKRLLTPSDKTDCVRVMNLHQAKGLEENIVINYLAYEPDYEIEKCAESDIRRSHAEYITSVDGKTGIASRPKVYMSILYLPGYARWDPEKAKYSKKYYNLFDQSTEDAYREAEKQEVIRRMYVRDTRARVVEYNFLKPGNKEPDNDNSSAAGGTADNPAYTEYTLKRVDTQGLELGEHYITTSPSGLEKKEKKKKTADAPVTPETEKNDDVRNEDTAENDTPVVSDSGDDEKQQEVKQAKGGEYGTIMHRAFELYLENRMLSQSGADASLGRIVKQAVFETCADGSGFEKYYDSALNDLQVFAREFAAKYGSAEAAMETSVYGVFSGDDKMVCLVKSAMEADDEQNITKASFSGKSDLIVFTDNGACIVDYKSDVRRDGESDEDYKGRLTNKYLPQQKAYYTLFKSFIDGLEPKMTLYPARAGSFVWLTEDYETDQ
ncbi:MAG: UvrD-helicase domain-containing protein [Clostridia bacterium]|nr:UvrD-helicase domain-containing protein [Clostridia bacterium]